MDSSTSDQQRGLRSEVGRAAAAKLVGVPFTDIKMKRGDRVINVAEQNKEPLLHQHCFLRSPNSYLTNKIRLISIIAQYFANDSVQCQKAGGGGAESLIVSTALDVSNPVLVVVTDADILVTLVNPANGTHGGVYVGRGLASCVNVLDTQEKIGSHKTYLLFTHAVSRCDRMSVLFGKNMTTMLPK